MRLRIDVFVEEYAMRRLEHSAIHSRDRTPPQMCNSRRARIQKEERKEESKHDGNMVTITVYYTSTSTPAIERLSTLESYSQDLR